MDRRLPFLNPEFLKNRILWSINLRWLAIAGVAMALMAARYIFYFEIPYSHLTYLWVALIVLNTVYSLVFRNSHSFTLQAELRIIFVQIVIDLILLTFLIHYSGGLENPFFFFYIFHILLTSILFPTSVSYLLAGLIYLLFGGVIVLEAIGVIPHYTLYGTQCFRNTKNITVLMTVFAVGTFVTAYISATFINSYRKIKLKIDEKNMELEQKNLDNTKFFNFASHELKSPVIAIKSTLDAVAASYKDSLPEQVLNLLNRTSDRSSQLLSMITEILDISRKQTKSKSEDISSINLNDLIIQVVQNANSVIQSKNLQLTLKLAPDVPNIDGTRYDYVQIFNNLIFNAAYYTGEKGEILVESAFNEAEHEISVKISDTGIGIAEEDREKIFREFYRAENAKHEVRFGTGLGLSLVRQLIISNGGRIKVESELGRGSAFTVFLPEHQAADADMEGAE